VGETGIEFIILSGAAISPCPFKEARIISLGCDWVGYELVSTTRNVGLLIVRCVPEHDIQPLVLDDQERTVTNMILFS